MSRLIDADALIDFLDVGHLRHPSELCFSEVDVANLLLHAPTISPDEVRGVGEWIVKQTAIGKDYTICSVCKTDFKFKTDKGTLARLDMRGMPFCPSCGARMSRAEAEKAMEVTDDA